MTNAASVPPPHQSKRQSFVLPSNYLCWADLTAAGFFGNKKVRRRGARVRNAQNTMSPWSGSFGELYCVSVDKVNAAERLQHGTELGRALCRKSPKELAPQSWTISWVVFIASSFRSALADVPLCNGLHRPVIGIVESNGELSVSKSWEWSAQDSGHRVDCKFASRTRFGQMGAEAAALTQS